MCTHYVMATKVVQLSYLTRNICGRHKHQCYNTNLCTHHMEEMMVMNLYYTTYVCSLLYSKGVPDPPQNLALQASSISPSLPPVLSWQRPPNIPEDVPLTYHLQITNLTSNERVLNMIETLSYPLPDGTGCSLFTFSVTASNDVGNSTTISIMETVPISKF